MSFDTLSKRAQSPASVIDPVALTAAAVYAPVLCMADYKLSKPELSWVSGYQGVQLGDVDVFRYEGVGLHCGDRKPSHIGADRMEDYLLSIPLRACVDFCQAGQAESIEPGQFTLLSTARPFSASVASLNSGELFSALQVRVAGAVLRQRMPHVELCCGVPIRLRSGAGVIMQRMCELAIAEGRGLSPNEGRQLASMLVDAVTSATAEAPEILALPLLDTHGAYLRIARQAKTYIEMHLSDPELDTDAVAAHCRVSKRYLQAVFASSGETVRSTIREMRLERCREALRNPALRGQSVAQIATHWGFADLPHFCRSYKARFNRPPSRDRRLDS